ncbi:hypothetical protein CI109_101103 [Kwoniella shandongensis]|uniref:Uncharacterized protein n=1 Tax=Kwoniella shandongensis TaxID=1734106 RepID=A0A5M6C9T8_9TREE|nr:uncharacterized protein CI109_001571 [Kwoniella shandongensis]KAA5530165.1 hypothetical protein CI109_001571 [Kwoniella shandongensis]
MLPLSPSSSTPNSNSLPPETIRTPQPQQPSLPPIVTELRDPRRSSPVEAMQISREATPSSPSASASASASASSPRSGLDSTTGISGDVEDDGDMDRLLKKVEMEKKMHALQQRLELASVKATNGWTDMTINEIENKLPPTPLRTRKSQLTLLPASPIAPSPQPGPSIPYEPPSPSRPWQLIDVLWQPLPPPSHGRYPTSPSSPKKRSRTEEHPEAPRLYLNGSGQPLTSPNQSLKGSGPGHRRASSSMSGQTLDRVMQAGPSSPLRYGFQEGGSNGKKKRSQSQSTHQRQRRDVTTSQDVDAAKALTFMLGSGGSEEGGSMSRRNSQLSAPLLPSLATQSLPIPEAFRHDSGSSLSPTLRPRALSQHSNSTPRPADLRTPSSHARSRLPPDSGSSNSEMDREEEDKDAAELMMFLAHSPSPMKSLRGYAPGQHEPGSPTRPSLGAAARVLFADADDEKPKLPSPLSPTTTATNTNMSAPITPGAGGEGGSYSSIGNGLPKLQKTHSRSGSYSHSNLALATPITPDSEEATGFGGKLVEGRV